MMLKNTDPWYSYQSIIVCKRYLLLYSIYVLLEINQGHSNGNSVLSNIYTTILQGDQFVDDGY